MKKRFNKTIYVTCGSSWFRAAALVVTVTLAGMLAIACTKSGAKTPPTVPIDPVQTEYPIGLSAIRARDPFVITDEMTKTYYLVVSSNPGFKTYSSKNLKNWKDNGKCYTPGSDYWGTKDFWAPDIYRYKGKYYLFATFSGNTTKRGTALLVADAPTGPYQPVVNKAVTPPDWMCLDGSLYVDADNKPWIIYCHEWLEAVDGQILAQRLSDDLTETVGEPKLLFKASQAGWTKSISASGVTGYVTDAPFVYRAKNGELLMTWSSFAKNGKYAIGLARSESGTLLGPWKHDSQPLNNDDGGHAMLFNDFDGNLMISYHSPNSATETPVIYPVSESSGKLSINK